MKITRQEASDMFTALLKCKTIPADFKFSYAVAKNIDKLMSIHKQTDKKRFPEQTERMKEFYIEIQKIKTEDKQEYEKQANDIEAQFPDVKETFTKHNEFLSAYLSEEVEFDPYKIKDERLLPDKITPEQVQSMLFMIE